MCRGYRGPGESGAVPIEDLQRPASYRDALTHWGSGDAGWVAILTCRGRAWDDWLNDALEDDAARDRLVRDLRRLAGDSEEIAIWYAGFPDGILVTGSPAEFASSIDAQVYAEELEPAVRMVRAPQGPKHLG